MHTRARSIHILLLIFPLVLNNETKAKHCLVLGELLSLDDDDYSSLSLTVYSGFVLSKEKINTDTCCHRHE
jgi:hypothetical protein